MRLCEVPSLGQAWNIATLRAGVGDDAFLRVFRREPASVTGERFVVAFSVLGGNLKVHTDVTFPAEHW